MRELVMAVDGGYSEFGACSVSCGGGIQSRTCDNPAPQHGGANCIGNATRACNTEPCPAGKIFFVKSCVSMFVELRRYADTTYGGKIESHSCTCHDSERRMVGVWCMLGLLRWRDSNKGL